MTERPKFHCDLDGGIMVISALRYALGRQSYVPEATRTWIARYWDDLDEGTQHNVIMDVLDYLFYEQKATVSYMKDTDLERESWERFLVERLVSSHTEVKLRVQAAVETNPDKLQFLKDLAGPVL